MVKDPDIKTDAQRTGANEEGAPVGAPTVRPSFLASIVAACLVVFMILFIVTGPLKKHRQSEEELTELQDRQTLLLDEKESQLARLQSQEQLMARLREREPNFDLWSFMNTKLTETNLRDRANLEESRPRAGGKETTDDVSAIRLKLSNITLKDLVDLLHRIYAANDLAVMYRLDKLHVASDGKGLECDITLLTPKA
jgi:hypothetical protein